MLAGAQHAPKTQLSNIVKQELIIQNINKTKLKKDFYHVKSVLAMIVDWKGKDGK